jgi:hypothetical protein
MKYLSNRPNFHSKCVFLSANSVFVVQNCGTYLSQITMLAACIIRVLLKIIVCIFHENKVFRCKKRSRMKKKLTFIVIWDEINVSAKKLEMTVGQKILSTCQKNVLL